MKRFAVALCMLLLSGCAATHGSAVPDAVTRTASVAEFVVPELRPVIDTLRSAGIADSSDDLMNLTLYFRVVCSDWRVGEFGDGELSATALRDDMAANADKQIDDVQAGLLASAFKTACPPTRVPEVTSP